MRVAPGAQSFACHPFQLADMIGVRKKIPSSAMAEGLVAALAGGAIEEMQRIGVEAELQCLPLGNGGARRQAAFGTTQLS